jgi:3-deoxy-D-manno-octulosonic-acid transferase
LNLLKIVYDFVILRLVKILRPFVILATSGKLHDTLVEQQLALSKLRQKLRDQPLSGNVLWVHVSSAGEFLQAKPVIEKMKAERPEVQVALSFVSPSGMTWAQTYTKADVIFYVPLDTKHEMAEVVTLLKPKVLMLVKFDIWPNMISESKKSGAKVILISATLRAESSRNKSWMARLFFAPIYRQIDQILCVGELDQMRFLRVCPDHSCVKIAGDTRMDSVLTRQKELSRLEPPLNLQELRRQKKFICVAGSAWPADEDILVPAWQKLRPENSILIMVPHEPKSYYLEILEKKLDLAGLLHARYTGLDQIPSNLQVLVMDQVGKLADLYRIGDFAYVGAGPGGVHNTMEPAAWKLPVFFRPTYQNAPEAIELVEQKLFSVVSTPSEATLLLEKWMKNLPFAQDLGKKSSEFLEKSAGATYTCFLAINQEF